MTDDFANELAPPSKRNWFVTILLVAGAGLAFGWFLRELGNPQAPFLEEPPHPAVGKAAPDLIVEGWFDDQGVTAEELAGKVYVIDAWESWCQPCLQAAPHTVELYEQFKDRNVVFFGLTAAESDERAKSLKFLRNAKFPWRNAYGAAPTLLTLYHGAQVVVPQLWVVDKYGVIAWGGHPMALRGEVLEQLLKATEPVPPPAPAESKATGARKPSRGG